MWMSARLLTWSTGNSLPPDDSLLHKYLPRTKDSLIHLSLNQPHLHLPAALPCALLTGLKALAGAFHSLVWTGFTCLCQTQKHSTSLSSHPVEQGCHIIVFLLVFNRLKINIAFLYSPDGGADTTLAPEAKPFISRPSSIIGPNHTTLTPKKETLRSDNGVQQHYQIIMLPRVWRYKSLFLLDELGLMDYAIFRSSLQKISWQFLNLNFVKVYMVCLFLGWC